MDLLTNEMGEELALVLKEEFKLQLNAYASDIWLGFEQNLNQNGDRFPSLSSSIRKTKNRMPQTRIHSCHIKSTNLSTMYDLKVN